MADATENEVLTLFGEMRQGQICRADGKRYEAVADHVKDFKGFWHWLMEWKRRDGEMIPDVTTYLDGRKTKPKWVYLTENEVMRLCREAKFKYRALIMFLFDSGIRSPSELVNIRVSDFSDDFTRLQIRDEVSKTFGRRINLMLSSAVIRELVQMEGLAVADQVFPISPAVTNRYLKRLAGRVLGNGVTLAGDTYANLTMYDFRHISACYWLPRYKSESALKYRFGWKKTERIHYYTELLGMRDTITEDDVLLDVEKTEIERRIRQSERDRKILQERLDMLQKQLERIAAVTEKLTGQVGQMQFAG